MKINLRVVNAVAVINIKSAEVLDIMPYDPFGGDFEGILRDKDGNFWMCDEYHPAIYKFNPNGVLIDRYVPDGTSLLGDTPQAPGFYGSETTGCLFKKMGKQGI